MPNINKIFSCSIRAFPAFFTFLIIALVSFGAHSALAQPAVLTNTAPPGSVGDPCLSGGAYGSVNGHIAMALANSGNVKSAAAQAILSSFGTIDAAANYCFNLIQTAFQQIQSMITGISGNPFDWIMGMVLGMVTKMIVQMILTECMAIIADLHAIVMSIMNSICIPIPHLGLGINALHLSAKPCHGVSLGNLLGINPLGMTPYNYRNFGAPQTSAP